MGRNFISAAAPAVAAPLASATPLRVDLFDVHQGIGNVTSEKPRCATSDEVRAYLLDLARWRGIVVPSTATVSEAGIYDEGSGYILDMPGYGADSAVLMEETDEAGNVVRSSRIGTNAKGQIGLKADAVRKACALPKVRATRATKAKPDAAAVEAIRAFAVALSPEPAETADIASPAAVEPIAAVSPPSDALEARLAVLEGIVARLSRPVVAGKRQRSEAERRAIVRAWRMRCEMRARADLDRRALEAANGAYRGSLDVIAANARESAMLRDQQANARTAATAYKGEAEQLSIAHGRAMNRADRLARVAIAARTARRRLADDLRGARAESRVLMRKLQDARTAPAPAAAAPAYALAS